MRTSHSLQPHVGLYVGMGQPLSCVLMPCCSVLINRQPQITLAHTSPVHLTLPLLIATRKVDSGYAGLCPASCRQSSCHVCLAHTCPVHLAHTGPVHMLLGDMPRAVCCNGRGHVHSHLQLATHCSMHPRRFGHATDDA
jgi:hypothetical protein